MIHNVQVIQFCFTIFVFEHVFFYIYNLIREAKDNRFLGNSFSKGGRAMFVNQSSEARNKSLEVDRCNWSSSKSFHKSVKRRSQLEEVVQDCRRWSSNSPVQAESTQVTRLSVYVLLMFQLTTSWISSFPRFLLSFHLPISSHRYLLSFSSAPLSSSLRFSFFIFERRIARSRSFASSFHTRLSFFLLVD